MRILALAFLFLATGLLSADAASATPTPPVAKPAIPSYTHTERLPGVDLAEGISQITGTAVSPMLGVSSVGAWRYYHTPAAMRRALPWFCHPAAWGFGFALLSICFLKDLFGTVAPPFLKKPLDMLELFENKLSALVASAAFVPFIAAQMTQQTPAPQQTSAAILAGVHYASALPFGDASLELRLILLPFCILSFLVVWMTSHAINVLVALCPFGFVDFLLKLFKGALLSAIVLCSAINPYLGASLSLVLIVIAIFLAPTAFRLAVFGTLFAYDTLVPSRARSLATPTEAHAFAGKMLGLPARTYGKIVRQADGSIQFEYHPWMILPRQKVSLPPGALAISRGIYFPSLLHKPDTAETYSPVIVFLPRYRRHEDTIAEHLQIFEIRDSPINKGFKAIRIWFVETMTPGKPIDEIPHAANG